MTDKDKKNKLAPHLVPRRALASFSNCDTFGRVALLTSLFASVDVPLDQSSESRPAGPNLVQLLSRRFLMGSDCWPPAAAGVVVEPSTRQAVRVRCAPPAAAICIEHPCARACACVSHPWSRWEGRVRVCALLSTCSLDPGGASRYEYLF